MMHPANMHQVNNIRLDTLICFLAILLGRILFPTGHNDIQLSIENGFQSHP